MEFITQYVENLDYLNDDDINKGFRVYLVSMITLEIKPEDFSKAQLFGRFIYFDIEWLEKKCVKKIFEVLKLSHIEDTNQFHEMYVNCKFNQMLLKSQYHRNKDDL